MRITYILKMLPSNSLQPKSDKFIQIGCGAKLEFAPIYPDSD